MNPIAYSQNVQNQNQMPYINIPSINNQNMAQSNPNVNPFGMMMLNFQNMINLNNNMMANMNNRNMVNNFNMMNNQNMNMKMYNNNMNNMNNVDNINNIYNINNINNMNNMNNNLNANNLVNNMNYLSLNTQNCENKYKMTKYEELINYKTSDQTKLILSHNEISRQKLISNLTTVSPTLQCSICLDLVMIPVECEICAKLFCQDCIESWLKNTNECPNKHEFKKKEVLDDWIKEALGKIYLKCPYEGCIADYAYKHWKDHVKKCTCKNRGIKKITDDKTTEGDDDKPFIWENIQFFVKDINNKTHSFFLPLSTTVQELKQQLEIKTGFKVEQQRLECNGKTMEDSKMLEFYRLQSDQTIHQLGRLKGGILYLNE